MDHTEAVHEAKQASPLSAERLRAAFERMLQPGAQEATESPADAAATPEGILEALLFTRVQGAKPLPLSEAAELIQGVDAAELSGCIERLNAEYEASGSALRINLADDQAELRLKPGLQQVAKRLGRPPRAARLASKSLELLAVIAYRQPISLEQLDELFGESSGQRLRRLEQQGLIELAPAQPGVEATRYVTTERFLDIAGIDSPSSLPPEREFSE